VKLARWTEDNHARVRRSELPDAVNDRACDNWEPLLQIAAKAGGEWRKLGHDGRYTYPAKTKMHSESAPNSSPM